jgi:hypothetical protein
MKFNILCIINSVLIGYTMCFSEERNFTDDCERSFSRTEMSTVYIWREFLTLVRPLVTVSMAQFVPILKQCG